MAACTAARRLAAHIVITLAFHKISAAHNRLAQVRLNRFQTDIQALGDLFLRKTIDPAQDINTLAFYRQASNRATKQLKLLVALKLLFQRSRFRRDRFRGEIPYRICQPMFGFIELFKGQVLNRLKHIRPGMLDIAPVIHLNDLDKSLLHHVLDLLGPAKKAKCKTQQCRAHLAIQVGKIQAARRGFPIFVLWHSISPCPLFL